VASSQLDMNLSGVELIGQGINCGVTPGMLSFFFFKNFILLDAFDLLVVFVLAMAFLLMSAVLLATRNAEDQMSDVEKLAMKFSHKHRS
jgi:hypothetical protein